MAENALLVLTQPFEDFSTPFLIKKERERSKQWENILKQELGYPRFLQNCNCLWIHMVSGGWSKMYFIKVLKPVLNEIDILHMCVRVCQVNHCVPGSLSKVNEINWTLGEGAVYLAQSTRPIFNVEKFRRWKRVCSAWILSMEGLISGS